MKYPKPLLQGTFIKRYKRFFADVKLDSGEVITAHCPNTGSMKGLNTEGLIARVLPNDDPKRKLKYTLEHLCIGGHWVGVNTGLPNKIVKEALENKQIPELVNYNILKTEQKYGENSRIDILLEKSETGEKCYVEIKNVTLMEETGLASFPDAVTERGRKHLNELINVVKKGDKACIFYLINRTDCDKVTCAEHIDPAYAATFKEAIASGVQCLAYNSKITESEITVDRKVDVIHG